MHVRRLSAMIVWILACASQAIAAGPTTAPIDLGSRRELMADGFVIDTLSSGARLALHEATPREIAMVTDAPWEGNACHYRTIIKDGDLLRMYYLAAHYKMIGDENKAKLEHPHPPFFCYAESRDGIRWTRPELGLVEFNGSKQNNIVLTNESFLDRGIRIAEAGITPFKDTNPACPADAKYNAVAIARVVASETERAVNDGLAALKSPDGLHWSLMSDQPVITGGRFDSQNLAFWDATRGEYRAYHRDFNNRVRGIKTETSSDFLHWTTPRWIEFPGAAEQALYTNQVQPYPRAPHLLVGFPLRYADRGEWSDALEALPDVAARRLRSAASRRYGAVLTDSLFMCSRDGLSFKRWDEPLIRPAGESWVYGDNSIGLGVIETPASRPGDVAELSFYVTEGYWRGPAMNVRRYTLRVDGFVSVTAPFSGGEWLSKPLTFDGETLNLNVRTSAAGSVRVEMQDEAGKPLTGFTLDDCAEIFGNSADYPVRWKNGTTLAALRGHPVRLHVVMKDADLFAIQFR
jgi:hypothetical protein